MKNIAVVTSSIGANNLINPTKYLDSVDYHAFVEPSMVNIKDNWTRHEAIKFSTDNGFKNRRDAKIYKILPFMFLNDYEYFIWLDSTHVLDYDPNEIIKKYLNENDIAVFSHFRGCLYKEAAVVKSLNFDHHDLIDNQVAFYRKLKYPENNGLYELPVRIQRNTTLTKALGLMWWEQICKYSSRDQISFPFVCHTLNIKPTILPGEAHNNNMMRYVARSNHPRVKR
jgi:hypothetical protein